MNHPAPKPTLTLFEAVAATAGIVIGVGIFRLPSIVAGELQSDALIIGAWIAGGIISFIGALCYAELTTAFPSAGGEYHFLSRAFGWRAGFLFAWARMTVIQTGSITLLAFVLGDYLTAILPVSANVSPVFAAFSVVALTGLNILGVRQAAGFQKVLFILTIIGLAVMTAAGLSGETTSSAAASSSGVGIGAMGSAMIFVLLTYGGWNEAAYFSAEVRGGSRNMIRALLLSIGVVTVCYVLVNLAYLNVLGSAGVAESQAVASDMMRAVFGEFGAVAISILVVVVVLTSMNVTIFTGARTNFALGRDFPLFRFLGVWDEKRSAPVAGLLVQGGIALILVGLGSLNRGGIETAVDYLSPVFWFFLLPSGSLFLSSAPRKRTFHGPFACRFTR